MQPAPPRGHVRKPGDRPGELVPGSRGGRLGQAPGKPPLSSPAHLRVLSLRAMRACMEGLPTMISYRTAIVIAILTAVINSQAARADDSGTSLSELIVAA